MVEAQGAEIYNQLFAQEGLSESESFYRWSLQKLEPRPGATLLDVACGQGGLLRAAAEAGLRAFGLDFSRQALELARQAAPQAQLVLAEGEALPYRDKSFDYVTCLGSLEHFTDPWRGATEIRRVLKPEGLAAIFLPNGYYLADLLWHVLRKGRGPHHRQLVERFAAAHEWADFLTMMGLQVLKIYRYNFCWPRSKRDWQWYRRYPRKLLNLLLGVITPFHLSYSFLYVCKVGEVTLSLNERLPLLLRRPVARRTP